MITAAERRNRLAEAALRMASVVGILSAGRADARDALDWTLCTVESSRKVSQ